MTEPAAMPFEFEEATPAQALTAGLDLDIEYLAPAFYSFSAEDEGYSSVAPLQIRIKNNGSASTGSLDIVLTGSEEDDYSVTKTSLPSIGTGQSDYFNVAPKTGLITGTYTATVTVLAGTTELGSTELSFTVTPAGAKYPVDIKTYIDNVSSNMEGTVELRNLKTTIEVENTGTGIYKTTAPNGSYSVYVNGMDTNRILAVSNGSSPMEIDYYTVSFSSSYTGTATGSKMSATAGGISISSGSKVIKGTPVTITASGFGAASYTYMWSGSGITSGQTTESLNITYLSTTISALCEVTGVGVMPTDPDYKIGDNSYMWTGSDQTIVLSGTNETLSILKSPTAVIRIDVRSEDLSTVTIDGNDISCDKTYIEVYNDITLKLIDLTITAPDKAGVESSAMVLKKTDDETDQINIIVSGTCNLTGSSWGSGIRSIHDQDLSITGNGTLNVTGGSTTDSNLTAGQGIDMEGYTYASNSGARLTIDGGVTVNATGGNGENHNGGTGIRVGWGTIRIGNSVVTATGGNSSAASSWTPGHGIQVSFPANNHSKGGNILIEDGTVTATGGDSENTPAGRGIDAMSQLDVTGGTVTAEGGYSKKALGGYGIYAYEQKVNISGGTVTATGGDSQDSTAGTAIATYYKDVDITGGTVTAIGGNGQVNGSHAVYTHTGLINIGDGADVTAIGGNGTTGVGGVGLRAYGSSEVSNADRGTVSISKDAGDIYIRGGRGASATRDSVMGRNIYISTGNIDLISMEAGASRTIMNAEGGDNVYRMKAAVSPAAETVISSEVNGTPGRYTYRAVTKNDGAASLWLPAGSQTVSSSGYASKTSDIPGNDSSVKEVTLIKTPTVTIPGAPQNVTAVAGDRSAVVSFSPPANNGGSSVLSYIVTSSPGGVAISGSSSPITVTGLTNGVSYTFTVKAVNSAGAGTDSTPSAPVTPKAVVEGTYKVSGKVVEENGNPVPGAFLVLKKGNRQAGTTSTDETGNFTINGIPNGTYNLQVTKDGKVVTVLVVVDNEDCVLSDSIRMPSGTINSIVEVKTGAPDIVVGNLEEQFTQEDKEFAQISGNKVEIKLVADLKQKEEIKDDADKILNAAGGNPIGLYLDLSAYKTRTENSIPGTPERLGNLPEIIEIVFPLPENLRGKSGINVHRVHNGIPQTLQNGSPDENGEYFVAATDTITIYTKSFSTYAISYTESGTGGNAGSDSGSETSKAVCSRWPGQPVMGREDIPVTHTENGEAYAAITEKAVLDAATRAWDEAKAKGKTANGIGISLTVKDLGDEKVVGFVIPQYILKILTEKYIRQFELKSDMIVLNLDLEALRNLRVQSTGDVTITMAPETRRSGNAQTMIMNRPVYRVTAGYNKDGNHMEIKSIGNGSAIYSIPYTPDKEETGYLYAVSVDEQGNAARITNSAYDTNTKSIIFTSNQFQTGGVGYTQGNRFTDISTHWAKEAMDYADGRGLITGISDTVFSPDGNITRGILATALGRLANVDPGLYQANSFTDVSSESNAASYADWANKKGIIKATGNGQFLPDQPVTREEMALILQNYTKAVMSCPLSITRDAINYDDNASIDSVYKKAVTSMQQAGVIMGEKNNHFNPKNNVTRAQASMVLYRLAKLTIDPSSAQGWARNDGGQYLYYKDGKAYTGWLDTNGKKYYFYADGILATGTRIDRHDVDENGVMKTE